MLVLTKNENRQLDTVFSGDKDLVFDYPELYEKLYEYFLNSGKMPYGVAKARTGMPDVWILDELAKDGSIYKAFQEV
jgi:hypothetical protein